jgi:hypothetical protein
MDHGEKKSKMNVILIPETTPETPFQLFPGATKLFQLFGSKW